jgi:hypothetical protein
MIHIMWDVAVVVLLCAGVVILLATTLLSFWISWSREKES